MWFWIPLFIIVTFSVVLECGSNSIDAGSLIKAADSLSHPHVHLGKLATALNATIDPVIDASMNDLFRVYHGGNICPFKRKITPKLALGEKIKILIVGGSVTYGAELPDRIKQRWSRYFTDLVAGTGWYKGEIEIVNIGVGACNVDVWIERVNEMRDADLVIVDLTVNDQGFDLQVLPHIYRTFIQLIDNLPNHPALLFHQAFRTAKKDASDIQQHCPNEDQHGTCCNGFLYCKRWWDMQDFVGIALNRLGVPFVSYRDLAWPSFEQPPPNLDEWWNGMSHPDYRAHNMIAKLLAFGFLMQVKEAHLNTDCTVEQERYVSAHEIDETIQPICNIPLTYLHTGETPDSVQFFPLKLVEKANMWRYFNDSQLKYGWILDQSREEIQQKCVSTTGNQQNWCDNAIEASILSFDVEFGVSPRLQITFLKSQDSNMGSIAVWLDNHKEETVLIDGHWDIGYSVRHTITFSKEVLSHISTTVIGDSALFPSMSAGKHTVHMSLPPSSNNQARFKWKLLGVTAC